MRPYKRRLAPPGSGAGLEVAQNCGLGDESGHACGTGVCGIADGHCAKKYRCRANYPFRQGHVIRKYRAPSVAEKHSFVGSMSRKGNCWDTQSKISLSAASDLTRAGIGVMPLR